MKIKTIFLSIMSKINFKNFDNGMNEFNKSMKSFGDSMKSMNDEISEDVKESNKRAKLEEEKNQRNLDKIWGKKE